METRLYQTSSKRSPLFWLLIGARKTQVFWYQSEARTAATVWNWSGKTLSPGALLAVLYFSSRHIFPPVSTFPRPHYLPLDGSPRMSIVILVGIVCVAGIVFHESCSRFVSLV